MNEINRLRRRKAQLEDRILRLRETKLRAESKLKTAIKELNDLHLELARLEDPARQPPPKGR